MPERYVAVRPDGTVVRRGDKLKPDAVFHTVTRPAAGGKSARIQVNGPRGSEYYARVFGLTVYRADQWARAVIAGILTDHVGGFCSCPPYEDSKFVHVAEVIVRRLQGDGLLDTGGDPLQELAEEFPAIAYLAACGEPAVGSVISENTSHGDFCARHLPAATSQLEPPFVVFAVSGRACAG